MPSRGLSHDLIATFWCRCPDARAASSRMLSNTLPYHLATTAAFPVMLPQIPPCQRLTRLQSQSTAALSRSQLWSHLLNIHVNTGDNDDKSQACYPRTGSTREEETRSQLQQYRKDETPKESRQDGAEARTRGRSQYRARQGRRPERPAAKKGPGA